MAVPGVNDPYWGMPHTEDTDPPEDVELEQLGPRRWTWVYQGPTGSFYRGIAYKSQAAARKAGREWLANRQDPRRRGR